MNDTLRFLVGFDLSFRSSACAVFDILQKKWFIMACACRQREVDIEYHHNNVHIKLFPLRPEGDVPSYLHVEGHFFDWLLKIIPKPLRRHATKVAIEAYVYADPSHSGYSYKLHELGGIIKRQLALTEFTDVQIVPNTTWKAQVIGHGFASKLDIVHFIATHGPCVNMLTLLGFDETLLPLDEKNRRIIPTPSQDLADSVAISMWLLDSFHVKKPKKRRLSQPILRAPKKKHTDPKMAKTSVITKVSNPKGFIAINCQDHLDLDPAFNDDRLFASLQEEVICTKSNDDLVIQKERFSDSEI